MHFSLKERYENFTKHNQVALLYEQVNQGENHFSY